MFLFSQSNNIICKVFNGLENIVFFRLGRIPSNYCIFLELGIGIYLPVHCEPGHQLSLIMHLAKSCFLIISNQGGLPTEKFGLYTVQYLVTYGVV